MKGVPASSPAAHAQKVRKMFLMFPLLGSVIYFSHLTTSRVRVSRAIFYCHARELRSTQAIDMHFGSTGESIV